MFRRRSAIYDTLFVVSPTVGEHAYKEKIILKAGTSTALEIPFAGSPQPIAKWSFKGGKLPDAKRFKVETIANMTSMTMSKVVRSDSGKYTVELQSDLGKAKVDIEVVVLGKMSHRPFVVRLTASINRQPHLKQF